MQSEKDATFSKERRFRRINVLSRRRLSGENAPRKSDDFADVVANRKHQPAAKTIVEFTITAFFVTQFHQPAREQFPSAIAFVARPLAKRIPTFRRVTELPRYRYFPTDRERGRLFLMKGTKRLKTCACSLQRKISSDHFHDVVRGCDLLDCFRRDRHFSLVPACLPWQT